MTSGKKVANRLSHLLDLNMESTEFISIGGPQQSNGFGCGVFTCWNIESLVLDIVIDMPLNLEFLGKTKLSDLEVIHKRTMIAYVLFNSLSVTRDSFYNLMVEKNCMKVLRPNLIR